MTRLLLLIAVGYPVVLIGVLIAVAATDPFLLFRDLYGAWTFLIAPGVVTAILILLNLRDNGPSLAKTLFCVGWVIAITFTHALLVAAIAGGV